MPFLQDNSKREQVLLECLDFLTIYEVGKLHVALVNTICPEGLQNCLKSIQTLRDGTIRGLNSSGAEWISKHCPNLNNISIYNHGYFGNVTNETLRLIGKRCRKLSTVSLSCCATVTDMGLQSLVDYCSKSLKRLDISDCYGITDKGIKSIAERCTGLQYLSLSCCSDITDLGISAIASNCCDLRSLNLEGCRRLTDAALDELSNSCKQLETLIISGCPKFSSHGLCTAFARLRHLSYVLVCGNRGVTDEVIRSALTHCPKLRVLDLAGCNSITDVAVCEILTAGKACAMGASLVALEALEGVEAISENLIRLSSGLCVYLSDCRDIQPSLLVSLSKRFRSNDL